MRINPGLTEIHQTATEYDGRLHRALLHARAIGEDTLANLPVDVIVQSLVDEHAAAPIEIDFDTMWMEEKEPPVRPLPAPPDDGSLSANVNFKATGCTGAFWNRFPLQMTMYGSGDGTTISIHLRLRDEEPRDLSHEVIGEQVSIVRAELQRMETIANAEIEAQGARLAAEVRAIVSERSRRTRAFRHSADALRIPLSPQEDSGAIELRPRGVTLRQLDQDMNRGRPEWHLEDDIAEDITKTIMSFTIAMERLIETADALASAGEETIRDLLLFILNANYQGAVTGETFIKAGKSDILLRWRDRDAFLGECKIWKDKDSFVSGITQLLDRYTVWRNTRAALILFIRNRRNITQVIENANLYVTNHPRFIQAIEPQDPAKRRDYLMSADNDEKRIIRMSLLPVVIPRPR